jgi:hypothetical protein
MLAMLVGEDSPFGLCWDLRRKSLILRDILGFGLLSDP